MRRWVTKRQVATENPRSPRHKGGIVVAISSSCGYEWSSAYGNSAFTGPLVQDEPGRRSLRQEMLDTGSSCVHRTESLGRKGACRPSDWANKKAAVVQTGENIKIKYDKIREHSRQHTRCAMRPH